MAVASDKRHCVGSRARPRTQTVRQRISQKASFVMREIRTLPEAEVIRRWAELYAAGKNKGIAAPELKQHMGRDSTWVEVEVPHDMYDAEWNTEGGASRRRSSGAPSNMRSSQVRCRLGWPRIAIDLPSAGYESSTSPMETTARMPRFFAVVPRLGSTCR